MSEMTDREKYLFDVQGYLVVREFLTPEEVARLNAAIDANREKMTEHEGILPGQLHDAGRRIEARACCPGCWSGSIPGASRSASCWRTRRRSPT